MRMLDVFKLAAKLLREQAKTQPNRVFENASGDKITAADVATEIEKLTKWMYPDLSCEDIAKVVRCRNCQHFKKYRKKGAFKATTFQACEYDKDKRDPEFYCKRGLEK